MATGTLPFVSTCMLVDFPKGTGGGVSGGGFKKPETIPMEKGELQSTEMPDSGTKCFLEMGQLNLSKPGGEQVYQQPGGLWPQGTDS